MSQSKRHSALETATNTAVGFFGSYAITLSCFHLESNIPTATLYATLGCTVWSLLRGYYLRRVFNHLHMKAALKEKLPEGFTVGPCNHMYVSGFGGMGDAVVCCKCGVDKYPEAAPGYWLACALGRVIKEDHPEHERYADLARTARTRRKTN
jgi:hypothetical protein